MCHATSSHRNAGQLVVARPAPNKFLAPPSTDLAGHGMQWCAPDPEYKVLLHMGMQEPTKLDKCSDTDFGARVADIGRCRSVVFVVL